MPLPLASKPQAFVGRIRSRRFCVSKCDGDRRTKFNAPASKKDHWKLYALKAGGVLIYVGVTRQRMSTRLRGGLRKPKRKGVTRQYLYKWRNLQCPLILTVWTTPWTKEQAEAVEAELVFSHRTLTERWPKYQNEIHFNNKPGAAELAAKLYAKLVGA